MIKNHCNIFKNSPEIDGTRKTEILKDQNQRFSKNEKKFIIVKKIVQIFEKNLKKI